MLASGSLLCKAAKHASSMPRAGWQIPWSHRVTASVPCHRVTLANAGHLAPYRNGVEMEIEGCLPLGLIAQSSYTESSFMLGVAEQLTLVTDGVVEARGDTGELFGFDRTVAISRDNAQSIADTAQTFGQDDDITVVTVVRVG